MKEAGKKKKLITAGVLCVICLVQLCLWWHYGKQKEYLMCDELFSYTSSNNAEIQAFDMPLNQWLDKDWYLSQAAVTEGHAFDYAIPYRNQEADVHPPFYYVLLHTLSSFVPGQVSVALGVALNCFFLLGCTIFLYLNAYEIFRSRGIALAVAALYGLTYGACNTAAFIRMYAMFSFWLLVHVYVYLHFVEQERMNPKTYVLLGLSLTAGALTHYYFVLAATLLAAWYFVKLWVKKHWKEVSCYHVTLELSAVAALAIFPAMWKHVFNDYRGEETRENLVNLAGFKGNLKIMYGIINDELFGGFLPLFLAAAAVLLMVYVWKKKQFPRKEVEKLFPVLFMTCGYFLLVTKVAPYMTDRYLMPVFSFTVLIAAGSLCWLLGRLIRPEAAVGICAAAFLLPSLWNLSRNIPSYVYPDFREHRELAETYADKYCVYIDRQYDWWEYYGAVQLLKEYKSFYCISYAAITDDIQAGMEAFADEDEILVWVGDSQLNEEITEYIRETVGASELEPVDDWGKYHIYLAKRTENQ